VHTDVVHTPLHVLVGSLGRGVLPAAVDAEPPEGTVLLDLGPDHPSNTGLLELRLWTQQGLISRADVVVGAMHRGAEKLFEVRDYRQIGMLADRHDWQAPFAGELLIALAGEQLLGLEVPVRATWLRTLLAEHTRILSHLGFLSFVAHVLRRSGTTAAVRERLRDQTLALTGNRIHPMICRIGGLAADASSDWLRDEAQLMVTVAQLADELGSHIDGPDFTQHSLGVAPLSASVISAYGVSGPAARGSGVDLDLRRSAPYLGYGELAESILLDMPRAARADAQSRFLVWAAELASSAALVRSCTDRLLALSGPVAVRLGKIVRLPEGETYAAIEAPLGMAGCFLVSRGEKTPWRLKLRTPSFANVASLESLLIGVRVDQLEVALASMGYVVGDVDR
jgi:NADH-quinone oxidoreductase subunit D